MKYSACPSLEQLAAAATGQDPTAALHADGCAVCRDQLAAQQDIRALARRMTPPVLSPARRAQLMAEVMAATDAPAPPRRWTLAFYAIPVAAAAAVVIVGLGMRTAPAPAPVPVPVASQVASPAIALPVPPPSPTAPPAAPSAAAEVVPRDAQFTRTRVAARDTVDLVDGELTIDSRDRDPVVVVARDTSIAITASRVTLTAHAGVIVAAQVFAGSAEIVGDGGRSVITAGEVWRRPVTLAKPAAPPAAAPVLARAPDVAPAAPTSSGPVAATDPEPAAPDAAAELAPDPAPATASLVAFRIGWSALQAGRNADAIAAFDRATDPVVAEDAAFWAAVAADRASHHVESTRRLRAFLVAFPSSPRVEAVRRRLAP